MVTQLRLKRHSKNGEIVVTLMKFKHLRCCYRYKIIEVFALSTTSLNRNYVQAYDDEDPDLARQALSSSFIRHMDVEYARLARDLKLPKGISTAPKANVIENATASYKSPNTAGSTNDVSINYFTISF